MCRCLRPRLISRQAWLAGVTRADHRVHGRGRRIGAAAVRQQLRERCGRGRISVGDCQFAAGIRDSAAGAELGLSRAVQAIQAMQSVQSAARTAAQGVSHSNTLNVNVPNGLTPGGLVPNMAAGWSGANAPTQSSSNGQVTVGIQQTAPQAILNWQTFNVGALDHRRFQPAGQCQLGSVEPDRGDGACRVRSSARSRRTGRST